MNISDTDPNTQAFAGISEALKEEYVDPSENRWEGSPFAWIRTRVSRQKGKIGEQIVERWCTSLGLTVKPSPDSQADRVIEGKRVEIKLSTLWANDIYKFQQIRDQNYDYLLCLGVSPFKIHMWFMKKSDVPTDLPSQHGGKAGTDTKWLSFDPKDPPAWIRPFGGELADALKLVLMLKN